MGQYYEAVIIANRKDPKWDYTTSTMRILVPFDYGDTLKLFEIAYYGGRFARAVASQAVRTHKNWLPPRMAVIGDYAEIGDAPSDDGEAMSMILNRCFWSDKFRYKEGADRVTDPDHWIALNHDKKEYVKLGICETGKWTRADPLILLLAVGNGRGGGDYDGGSN